jgi:hypothetical protein
MTLVEMTVAVVTSVEKLWTRSVLRITAVSVVTDTGGEFEAMLLVLDTF